MSNKKIYTQDVLQNLDNCNGYFAIFTISDMETEKKEALVC